jgi:hypothetical protein
VACKQGDSTTDRAYHCALCIRNTPFFNLIDCNNAHATIVLACCFYAASFDTRLRPTKHNRAFAPSTFPLTGTAISLMLQHQIVIETPPSLPRLLSSIIFFAKTTNQQLAFSPIKMERHENTWDMRIHGKASFVGPIDDIHEYYCIVSHAIVIAHVLITCLTF